MIIRERENEYVLIEQNHHAQISGDILKQWKHDYFLGSDERESVEYAAYQHDIGWKDFDKQPFLNDKTKKPFSFIDFPDIPKMVLYKHGINEVERIDPYAGLLCSEHYKRFLADQNFPEAQSFVNNEELRQRAIIDTLPHYDERLFNFHYGLLQLSDNLSLYVCINEPGINKELEHSFFKDGMPTSSSLHDFCKPVLHIHWEDTHTVVLDDFPFEKPLDVSIKQKVIAKSSIVERGLIDSYETAPMQEHKLTITSVSQK